MKKYINIVFVISLLFALILPITYSYAKEQIESNVEEKQFFEISKTEITKTDKIEMTVNLNSISYNKFLFELKSDNIMQNVEITQNDQLSAENSDNKISMEIDKEKTDIESINLYCSIPNNKNVGDIIKFTASIANKAIDELGNEVSEELQTVELEVKIVEEKNDDKQENEKPSVDNNKQDGQILNTDNNKQNNQNNQIPSTGNNNQMLNISNNNVQSFTGGYSNNTQYSGMANNSFSAQETKVVYNGSDNNYLKKISVSGYKLNKEFSKENTTYFITVENDVESLDITAKVENSNATACVYGNQNLEEGMNKILISVTAENGNVRNYRIYVTKK